METIKLRWVEAVCTKFRLEFFLLELSSQQTTFTFQFQGLTQHLCIQSLRTNAFLNFDSAKKLTM